MFYNYLKKLIFALAAAAPFSYSVLTCQAAVSAKQDLRTQLQGAALPGWGAEPSVGSSLPGIIQAVISALLGLLGIIFLVLIIYAGYNWMTAQGDEDKVKLAKDTLTRAVIGLVVITLAYAITFFVFSSLPGGEGVANTSSSPVINTQ